MICRVCSRGLDHYIDATGAGWQHTIADLPADHDPVPVPAPPGWRGRCDFCTDGQGAFVLPANTFRAPGATNHASEGDWSACAECAALIRADDWRALEARVMVMFRRRHGFSMARESRLRTRRLYAKLRQNVTGPLRPLDDDDPPAA